MVNGGGAQKQRNKFNIKAVIALSAWLSNSNVTYNNTTSILLSGQYIVDQIVYIDTFYNNTPKSTEKLLFEISGGNSVLYVVHIMMNQWD